MSIFNLVHLADAIPLLTDPQVVLLIIVVALCLLVVWFVLSLVRKVASLLFSTIWFVGCGLLCLSLFFCSSSDSQRCPQPWYGLSRVPVAMIARILGG